MKLLNTKKEPRGMFEYLGLFDEMDATLTREDLMEMKRQIDSWSYVVSPPLFIGAFPVRKEDR